MDSFILRAPPWRPPTRASAAGEAPLTDFPDLYATHPTQEEDQLTESNVMRGFTGKPVVTSETFSAHNMICEKLKNDQVVPQLSKIIADVEAARRNLLGSVGPNTFKLPIRSHLNDQKREAWISDLANPDIPLAKVARAIVPLGYKGDKMLELLVTRRIALPRAIWFVRISGWSDMNGLKNRAGFSSAAYTDEWTAACCEYTRKLLAEIVLPTISTGRPGINVKGKVKATLSDPALRQQWGSKFGYLMQLLRQLFSEGLISSSKFLEWQVGQLKSAHFGQLPFVLHLVEGYLAEHLESGILSSGIVEACLQRSRDIDGDALAHILDPVRASLLRVLKRPEAFISPRGWLTYSTQIEALAFQHVDEAHEAIREQLNACRQRVDNMLCAQAGTSRTSSSSATLHLIETLDKIRFPCDFDKLYNAFFHNCSISFPLRISTLLTWATMTTKLSASKPYVVVRLLAHHQQQHSLATLKLQDALTAWINEVNALEPAEYDIEAIRASLARLAATGLFSYAQYRRMMVARGETDARAQGHASLHQRLLRFLPNGGISLNGTTRRRSSSAASTDHLQSLKQRCSDLFGSREPSPEQTTEVFKAWEELETHAETSELARHLLDILASADGVDEERWALIASALEKLGGYEELAELCQDMLRVADSHSLTLAIADTISTFVDVWLALDVLPSLTLALLAAHDRLRPLHLWPLSATDLLLELESANFCASEIRRRLHGGPTELVIPARVVAAPAALPEVGEITSSSTKSECFALAERLLSQYGTMRLDWISNLVSNIVDELDRDQDLCERFAWLLAMLSERPNTQVGKRVVDYLCEREGAIGRPLEQLLVLLVARNVVTMPYLLSAYMRPLLDASFSGLRTRATEATDIELAYIDAIARLLASLTKPINEDGITAFRLHLRARWRCMLSGESLVELVRLISLFVLHESIVGPDTERTAPWRAVVDDVTLLPSLRQAFFMQSRAATAAVLEMAAGAEGPTRGRLLDRLAIAVNRFERGGNVFDVNNSPLEMWASMPAHKVIWHFDVIRIETQIYLEKQASTTDGSPGDQDAFLQQLMLDSDPALAEDLVQSFSPAGANRLVDAIFARVHGALTTNDDDDEAWDRLRALLSRLLASNGSKELRALAVSETALAGVCEAVASALESANRDEAKQLERPIFALLVAMRCAKLTEPAPGQQDKLGSIVRSLCRIVQLCPSTAFLVRLSDIIAYISDLGPPLRQAIRQAYDDTQQGAATQRLAWLVRNVGSPPATPSSMTPWEMLECAPLPGPNTSAINLERFNAHLVASGTRASRALGHDQVRFDSEYPYVRETTSMRDFRRNITHYATGEVRATALPSPALTGPTNKVVIDLDGDDDDAGPSVPSKRKSDAAGGSASKAAKTTASKPRAKKAK